MNWTQEQVELLKKLTDEGLSCAQIGKELGVSRNAIIGKQHRIKIRSRIPRSTAQENAARTKRSYTRAPWAVAGLLANGQQDGLLTDLPPEAVPNALKLMDLEADQCRWPIAGEGADMLFCSAPVVERLSYCPHHCCRAFNYLPRLTRAEHELHMRRLAKNHQVKAA